MRTGGLHFINRLNGGAEFWNWFFTFDYGSISTGSGDGVGTRVVAYDYHAAGPSAGRCRSCARLRGGGALIAGLTRRGR
jgi:hypothetical protein